MYCSHCGKKVGDAMLFCPFCGEAIVVPEQEESESDRQAADFTPMELETPVGNELKNEESTEVSTENEDKDDADAATELLNWDSDRRDAVDEWARHDEPAEPFEPLKLEEAQETTEDWRSEISRKKESVRPEKKPPKIRHHGDAEPVRLEGAAPKLELDTAGAKSPAGGRKPARKHANTLVPPKTMNPNDIFMAAKPAAYDDGFDAFDAPPATESEGKFDFDVEDETGFFMRHLRGIVSLVLFGFLILLFIVYAFSRGGQQTLARANLAWSTDAYSQLGYQSYQAGGYGEAGLYYERALTRDPDNYSFASSAAMAYYEAGNTEKSAAMLKRCIEINPTLLEPYIYLLRLYPDAAQRPWDVTQLLQQGYQRTGDTRLNVTG